jgi:hypothetical protein
LVFLRARRLLTLRGQIDGFLLQPPAVNGQQGEELDQYGEKDKEGIYDECKLVFPVSTFGPTPGIPTDVSEKGSNRQQEAVELRGYRAKTPHPMTRTRTGEEANQADQGIEGKQSEIQASDGMHHKTELIAGICFLDAAPEILYAARTICFPMFCAAVERCATQCRATCRDREKLRDCEYWL